MQEGREQLSEFVARVLLRRERGTHLGQDAGNLASTTAMATSGRPRSGPRFLLTLPYD